jgi:hypothetical protein
VADLYFDAMVGQRGAVADLGEPTAFGSWDRNVLAS